MEEEQLEAIDTSSGDESAGLNTSAPPAPAPEQASAPAIDTGDAPVPAAPQAPQEESAGPNGPIARNLKAFPGNVKRIASYLMGEGAADPMAVKQAGAQVDPQGQLSESDRNLLAIQKAAETEGPEAAWSLAQGHRVAYNAKQAFAYAAIRGNGQKPPDLNAAVDAANQAASHVLDGTDVNFMVSQAGQITATVKTPGSDQPQVIDLPIEAFVKYLNVGGAGQYDRVQGQTVPKTLAALAQGGIRQGPQQAPMKPFKPAAPTESEAFDPSVPKPAKSNFGSTPSTMNLSGSDDFAEQPERPPTSQASLEERANRMFPSVSQTGEREAWMNSELQRGEQNENKIDVANAQSEGKKSVATINAGGRVAGEEVRAGAARDVAHSRAEGYAARDAAKAKIEAAKIDQRMREMGSRNNNAAQHEQMASIRAKILSMQPLTPEETAVYTRVMGKAPGDQPAPQQQAPAPQQQAPAPQKQGNAQQPPVQGAKLYKGTWYTRGPNGESVPYQP